MRMPETICVMGGCDKVKNAEECKRCGFNPQERDRRSKLPLTEGKDGKLSRYVGRKRKNG